MDIKNVKESGVDKSRGNQYCEHSLIHPHEHNFQKGTYHKKVLSKFYKSYKVFWLP